MQEEIGDNWFTGIHVDDLDRCRKSIPGCLQVRTAVSLEYRLRRHDGEYRWIMDAALLCSTRTADLAGYIGTCMDLTERKDIKISSAAC